MAKDTLTAARLRELLDYNPDTGEFRWKPHNRTGYVAGTIAGTVDAQGYRRIRVDGTKYKGHRLAWLYVHGVWPADEVDHRNGNKDDNRITNLREATHAQNMHNQVRPQRGNPSGFLGVHRKRGRWCAQIRVDRHLHHLGYFKTVEEASAAYLAAKAQLHPFINS